MLSFSKYCYNSAEYYIGYHNEQCHQLENTGPEGITFLEQIIIWKGWIKYYDESPVFVSFNAVFKMNRIFTMNSLF